MRTLGAGFKLIAARSAWLSIFTTAALLFAPGLSEASALSCNDLFGPGHAQTLEHLEAHGFPVTTRHGQKISLVSAGAKTGPQNWFSTKAKWLGRGKSSRQEDLVQARANLIEGMTGVLSRQQFNVRIEHQTESKMIAIDKADPNLHFEIDLAKILSDRKFARREFVRIESLSKTRELIKRAKHWDASANELTEQGFFIKKPLRKFAQTKDETLIAELKRAMKILSKKNHDFEAGFRAAVISGELLLRKGFEVEIMMSGRGSVLARVSGLSGKPKTEFMKLVEIARERNGGIFAMDPLFYSFARKSGGVSDTMNFDYSINIARLWDRPQDFESPSATLIHEILHLDNARTWLEEPENEYAQAMNGWMWAKGDAYLGEFSYKKYFQVDETEAAFGDSKNAKTPAEQKYFADRTRDLSRAVLVRLESIRSELQSGHFRTSVSTSGNYLQVEVRSLTTTQKSADGFVYMFPDLDMNTPRYTIVKRFLARLEILETRLHEMRDALDTNEKTH